MRFTLWYNAVTEDYAISVVPRDAFGVVSWGQRFISEWVEHCFLYVCAPALRCDVTLACARRRVSMFLCVAGLAAVRSAWCVARRRRMALASA